MSMIVRSSGGKRKDGKTQVYTWAACIIVFIFAISIAVAVKGGGGKKTNSAETYRKQAFDLGNMPFSDDSAEAYLLASNKYNDIAKNDLINGLFSKKDKQERQADDIANGVPAAADAEYKAAIEEQAAIRGRSNRPVQAGKKQAPVRTAAGNLNRSSVATTSASSGVSSTIWKSADKNTGVNHTIKNNAALIQQVKGGKAMGFVHAAQASGRAANNKDLNAAAAGAADAFQKGPAEVSKGMLETDLEKDALNWDDTNMQEKLDKASNSEELAELDTKLAEKKKEKDEEAKEECTSFGCQIGQFAMELAKTALSAWIGGFF